MREDPREWDNAVDCTSKRTEPVTSSIYLAMTATWPGSWALGKTPDAAKRRLREIHGKLTRGRVTTYRFVADAEPSIDDFGRLSSKSAPEHVSGPDVYQLAGLPECVTE